MLANSEKRNDIHPFCKPFRLLELVVTSLSFILLFYLRQFHAEDEIFCSPTTLCIFFTFIGSTFAVTLLDNLCQAMKIPIPNKPVLLSLVTGAVFCFACGVTALLLYLSISEKPSSHVTRSTLTLLAGTCFFDVLLYVLDLLVVIRFSRQLY